MRVRVLMIATLLVLASCTGKDAAGCEASAIPPHDDHTLVVEGDPWSGYAPFRNPRLLDGTGYSIAYVEQLCQDVRAADVTSGKADFAVTTLDQYLLHRPAGIVVGVIDVSNGADALALDTVRKPFLRSMDNVPMLVRLAEEAGEKPVLAYTGNSPSEMLLNELANTSEDLTLTDFELVAVDQSASALDMLREGKAQLAIIWEPDVSAARTAGYTIARSSADVPDSIVDVIVASESVVARDPKAVESLVSAFYRAMDRYLADPAALQQLIATDGDLGEQEAKSVIDGIKLFGARDANAFMNERVFPLDQPRVTQSINAIAAVLALTHPGIAGSSANVDGHYVERITR